MTEIQSKNQFNAAVDPMGGPAFPIVAPSETDKVTGAILSNDIWPGMTLRDWFAGQATVGILSSPFFSQRAGRFGADDSALINGVASASYKFADAMISARNGGAS